MNTEAPSIFENIPMELWQGILTFLDDRSKRVLRLANKEWFDLINYDNFTIFFARDDNLPSIMEHFSKFSKPISLSFQKSKLSAKQLFAATLALNNIKSLKYDGLLENATPEDWLNLTHLTGIQDWQLLTWQIVPEYLLNKLTNVRKLVARVSAEDLAKSVTVMTDLENLLVTIVGGFSIDPLAEIPNPSKLTKLSVEIEPNVWLSLPASVQKLKQFTNLKALKFVNPFPDIKIALDQLNSLEALELNSLELNPFVTNTNLTKLRWMGINKIPFDKFLELSQLKKLNVLEMGWPNNFTYRRFDVLTALTDLQKLAIMDDTAHNIRNKGDDRLMVQYIPTSLKSLLLSGNFEVRDLIHLEQLEELELTKVTDDLDYLTALTNLTNLQICLGHNISAINFLTKLKTLRLNGRKIPRDFKQLNLELLPNLESFILSIQPTPNMVNSLSKLTKLVDLTLTLVYCDVSATLPHFKKFKIVNL